MNNLYQVPVAELIDQPLEGAPFFVTSLRKMAILYVATFGLYAFYWFYKQWSSQRAAMPKKIHPAWRSFFQIFFTHSLCRRIAERLAGRGETWKYRATAWSYVGLMILSSMIDKAMAELTGFATLAAALNLLQLWPLLLIQRKSNLATDDATGSGNSRFSTSNIVFVILGVAFWLAYLFVLLPLMSAE